MRIIAKIIPPWKGLGNILAEFSPSGNTVSLDIFASIYFCEFKQKAYRFILVLLIFANLFKCWKLICVDTYCEIIYFRGAQFSWIHENEYIRGDVISWI